MHIEGKGELVSCVPTLLSGIVPILCCHILLTAIIPLSVSTAKCVKAYSEVAIMWPLTTVNESGRF